MSQADVTVRIQAFPPISEWDGYFLDIAGTVASRAKCTIRKVGAVLVVEKSIISTGYNGTPAGTRNCTDGGCPRCAQPELYGHGEGYDMCLCVHAEANAVALAARRGGNTDRATCYTTLRPCFGCAKLLIQAGVTTIVYDYAIPEPSNLEGVYDRLLAEAGVQCYGRN